MAALMILIVSMVALAGADTAVDPHFTPRPAYVNANRAPVPSANTQPGAATILSIPLSVVATNDDHADDGRSAAGAMHKVVAKVVEKVFDVVADVREKVADAVNDFIDDAKAGSSSKDHDDVVYKNNDNSNETNSEDSEETDTLNDISEEFNDRDSAEKSKSSKDDNSKDDDKKKDDDGKDSKNRDSAEKSKSSTDDNSKDDDKEINDNNNDSKDRDSTEKSKLSTDDNSKDDDKKINDDGNDSKNKEKSSTEIRDKQKDNSKENTSGKNRVNGRDDSEEDRKNDDNTSNDKTKDEGSSEKEDGKSVWSFLKDLTGDIENESADDDTKVRHYLTRISKFRGYMDAMDSNFAVSLAKQSGTCPVYPIQVGNNRVTITTENGCKIIIKLKGLTVDKIEDGHEEKKRAHKRSILVSYDN